MAASLPGREARWYKKIDSTLRGNIGSELDALLDLLDAPAAVVCPAFPAQERGLRNGKLAAPELALPFSRRQVPKSLEWAPDSAVDLPSLLRQQSRHHVAALSLEEVREGELAARMKQALHSVDRRIRARRTILVVDALTDADLDEVVRAHEEAMPEGLLCGSAGLAGAFAQRVGVKSGFSAAAEGANRWKAEHWPSQGRTVLLVVGSGSESAHRQIAFLLRLNSKEKTGRVPSQRDGGPLSVSRMIVSPETDTEAVAALDAGRPVWLLQQPKPRPGAMLEGSDARRRAIHLAHISAAVFARRPPDLLILGGGDTAMQILIRLEVERLTVEREILPGMPLCSADIGGRPAQVVIKPGNFGGDGTLLELLTGAG